MRYARIFQEGGREDSRKHFVITLNYLTSWREVTGAETILFKERSRNGIDVFYSQEKKLEILAEWNG